MPFVSDAPHTIVFAWGRGEGSVSFIASGVSARVTKIFITEIEVLYQRPRAIGGHSHFAGIRCPSVSFLPLKQGYSYL